MYRCRSPQALYTTELPTDSSVMQHTISWLSRHNFLMNEFPLFSTSKCRCYDQSIYSALIVPDQAEVNNKSCSFDMRYSRYCTSTSPLRRFRFAVLQKSWIIVLTAKFFALVHCGGYIISLSLKGDCNENWCGRGWSQILGQRFRVICLLNMPIVCTNPISIFACNSKNQ
jgi:hypothetical protein